MSDCECACHRYHRGDQRFALHQLRYEDAYRYARAGMVMDAVGVDAEDALDAVVACAGCLPTHVIALTSRKCWVRPLPHPQPLAMADGYPYDPTEDTA